MISVEEALSRLLAPLEKLPLEQISIADAIGRVLAEDLAARRTQPPFAVSAMDGYAVRAEDLAAVPVELRIVAEVPAGAGFGGHVGPREAARIFTGAPMPAGPTRSSFRRTPSATATGSGSSKVPRAAATCGAKGSILAKETCCCGPESG